MRTQLFIVTAVSILPVVLAAGIALHQIREGEKDAALRGLKETVRATALIVDREVQGALSGLKALGTSPHLETRDFKAFYEQAKALNQPPDVWTLLLDSTGAQVLNTALPFDAQLQSAAAMDRVTRVIATQKPLVTDVFRGPVTGKMLTTIYAPAQAAGAKSFVVAQAFSLEHWRKTASQSNLPGDWVVAVIDKNGKFISRSHQADQRVGTQAKPELVSAAAASSEGVIRLKTLENINSYQAFAHSALTGWTIAIAAPADSVEEAARDAVRIALVGMLLAITAALLAVFYFGRRFINSFESARAFATALGQGRKLATVKSSIDEVNELNQALAEAGIVLDNERQSRRVAEDQTLRLLEGAKLAQEEAVAQNIAKDQFLAMLGHELRNPLAAISGATTLLETPDVDGDRQQRSVAIISRQNRHLRQIVDDLLDVSRMLVGKIELVTAPLDLTDCVKNCVDALRTTEAGSKARISIQAQPVWIDGDAVRVEQILNNLLGNALKFSAPDGEIRVRVEEQSGRALVSVEDKGNGMTPELLAHVFDPFVQGPAPADRMQSGLGIGLALVRQLVRLHHGEIAALSAGAGLGSTFTFWIPSIPGQQAPSPASAETAPLNRKIVYVEDNEDAREVMAQMLCDFGFEVIQAVDGKSALTRVAEAQPDVVLMDIGLPDMNGYELARRLKENPASRSIPLIALTGYGQLQDKDVATQAGFAAHLVKPVDLDDILRTIEEVLALKEGQSA